MLYSNINGSIFVTMAKCRLQQWNNVSTYPTISVVSYQFFFPSRGQRLMGHTVNIKYLIYASDWISSIRQTSVWSWASEYKCWGSNIKRWKKLIIPSNLCRCILSILLFCYHCFCCFPLRKLPDFDFFFSFTSCFQFLFHGATAFFAVTCGQAFWCRYISCSGLLFSAQSFHPVMMLSSKDMLKKWNRIKGRENAKKNERRKKWIYDQFPFFIKKKYHHLWWVHKFSNNLTDIRARKNIACAQKSSHLYNDSA